MIVRKNGRSLSRLYERDETAWLEKSAKLIKEQRYSSLDYGNLAEFLLDMAKHDRREVFSRLVTLMAHLLKRQYQSARRTRSWDVTILEQRDELHELLTSNTLKNHANDVLARAYSRAVIRAAAQTRLNKDVFPAECPYAVDELLKD